MNLAFALQVVSAFLVVISTVGLSIQNENPKVGTRQFFVHVITRNAEPILLTVQVNESSKSIIFYYHNEMGSYYSWTVYYNLGLQVFKSIFLGEIDRGDPRYHFSCFISTFNKKDLVPFDILLKLTQRDPGAIHKANVESPDQKLFFDQQVKMDRLKTFGSEIATDCATANSVLTSISTVKEFTGAEDTLEADLFVSLKQLPSFNTSMYPLCNEAAPLWDLGCICQVHLCVDWYPCDVIMCPRSGTENHETYLCGIQSCKKCWILESYVDRRKICFWNSRKE